MDNLFFVKQVMNVNIDSKMIYNGNCHFEFYNISVFN